jgi:hypothetical protein
VIGERATELTPWAVDFRYDDAPASAPLDRADALALVVAAREWATRTVGS